jgi:hypothetical protein
MRKTCFELNVITLIIDILHDSFGIYLDYNSFKFTVVSRIVDLVMIEVRDFIQFRFFF